MRGVARDIKAAIRVIVGACAPRRAARARAAVVCEGACGDPAAGGIRPARRRKLQAAAAALRRSTARR